MNIILPIAGRAQRFLDDGYLMPKPLIMAKEKHIIDWSISSIKNYQEHKLIFIVRQDHIYNFGIDSVLKEKFGDNVEIVTVDRVTEGALCTCLLASQHIDDSPLLIYTPDVYFEPQFDPTSINSELDGCLLTFKANSPAHSYVKMENNKAVRTAEKEVISNNAAVGVYYFKNGNDFIKYGNQMIADQEKVNNEYYICPVYNRLIKDGLNVGIRETECMHVLGTPSELRFFIDYVCSHFEEKPIALCSDHSGYELKEQFKNVWNGDVIDFGTFFDGSCDYHDYVSQAAMAIKDKVCSMAIGFCRTGQGINILANKYDHIRSALVFNEYTAEYAVRHNCCNFFSLPTKFLNVNDVNVIVDKILQAKFEGGRHMTRMKKTIDQGYKHDI
jgi:RpiB/LacA/LacB family sugar-phosphate isomerase|tara:strand:+ start:4138 stop:5295 length:1158 start_codon:yes stop_codon:yes gene_type:complete